jgi:hypothetical protein
MATTESTEILDTGSEVKRAAERSVSPVRLAICGGDAAAIALLCAWEAFAEAPTRVAAGSPGG